LAVAVATGLINSSRSDRLSATALSYLLLTGIGSLVNRVGYGSRLGRKLPESSENSLYGDPPKERKILGNLCATMPEQMKKAR
jgi:hypothetical protein